MTTTNPPSHNTNSGSESDPDNNRTGFESIFGDRINVASPSTKRPTPPGPSGFTPEDKRVNIANEGQNSNSNINSNKGNEAATSGNESDSMDTQDPSNSNIGSDTESGNTASYAEAAKPNPDSQSTAKHHLSVFIVDDSGKRTELNVTQYKEVLMKFALKQIEACESGFIPKIDKTGFYRGRLYSHTECDLTADWIKLTATQIAIGDLKFKAFTRAELDKELIMTAIVNKDFKALVVNKDNEDIFCQKLKMFNPGFKGNCWVLAMKELDDQQPQQGGVGQSFHGLWLRIGLDDDFKDYVEQQEYKLRFLMSKVQFKVPGVSAATKQQDQQLPQQLPLTYKQWQQQQQRLGKQVAIPKSLNDLLMPEARYQEIPDGLRKKYREKLKAWGLDPTRCKTKEQAVAMGMDMDTPFQKGNFNKRSKSDKDKTAKEVDNVAKSMKFAFKPSTLDKSAPGSPKPSTSGTSGQTKSSKESSKSTTSGKTPEKTALSGEEYRRQQELSKQQRNRERRSKQSSGGSSSSGGSGNKSGQYPTRGGHKGPRYYK